MSEVAGFETALDSHAINATILYSDAQQNEHNTDS
jgi:hypothetical protein